MAFKMKGFPKHKVKSPAKSGTHHHEHSHPEGKPEPRQSKPVAPMKSPAKSRKRKLKKGKLLKTENPDVAVTGGSIQEQINDLEDRIEFIMEGVERGTATRQQNKDIKAMEKRIATLRKQRDKDRDKYSQLNPRNPERD